MIDVDLDGRRLLVVGASSGIGRAVAVRAARAGAKVAVVARRAKQLDEVLAECGSGHAVVADISVGADCERAVSEAADALGGIDGVLHAAGVSRLALLADADADTWAGVFATNVTAPALVTRAALSVLQPGGVVAYLSSSSVGNVYHGLAPYTASKAALDQMITSWRLEHPELRFARIVIGPTIGTDFARDFDLGLAGELFPTWMRHGVLTDQMMEADEVGESIVQLFAISFTHPGVAMNDVVLHPPGPIASTQAVASPELLADLQAEMPRD